MALVNPYCTVAQVRAEIRNTSTTDPTDAALEEAINAASRFIDDYKGRDYYFHDYSASPLTVRKGDGAILKAFLYLPYWPIITLTAVTVNDEEWTEEDHYVKQVTRLISLSGEWPVLAYTDKIELTGTFGYTQAASTDVPTGLPPEITRAAILIAAAFSGHNSKEVVGVDGTKSAVIDKMIPKVAVTILGSRGVVV